MKKYRILKSKSNNIKFNNTELYRIEALRDFGDVKKGDFGGYVSAEANLSEEGDAWVSGNAWVSIR
jgi:hypothetical protein